MNFSTSAPEGRRCDVLRKAWALESGLDSGPQVHWANYIPCFWASVSSSLVVLITHIFLQLLEELNKRGCKSPNAVYVRW